MNQEEMAPSGPDISTRHEEFIAQLQRENGKRARAAKAAAKAKAKAKSPEEMKAELAELKRFAQSFKLSTPVPEDIKAMHTIDERDALAQRQTSTLAHQGDARKSHRGIFEELFPSSNPGKSRGAFNTAKPGHPHATTTTPQSFPPISGGPSFSSSQGNVKPPSAQVRQMVMPDRMRWEYLDPQGQVQGQFTGLEMNDWYKANFFTPDLRVKKTEDPEFEPLGQLVRRIGNSREPFLVPQIGIPHGPPTQAGPFSLTHAGETGSPDDASRQPAPSIHSSALTSTWTNSTINTQASTQTSIPSHSGFVAPIRDLKAARVMDSIEEHVENSPARYPVEPGLSKDSLGKGIDTLDHASLISATSTIITPRQREDVIERFSRAILKALRTNLNCDAATDWSRQHTLPLFRSALKLFTGSVEVDESEVAQVKGLKLIRHLRPDIARKVQDSLLEAHSQPKDPTVLVKLGQLTEMDISEKIGRWHSTSPHSYEPASVEFVGGLEKTPVKSTSSFSFSRKTDSTADSREETFTETPRLYGVSVNPIEILERLKEQLVFADLVGKIEALFQQYHGQKMHLIRQKTSLSLRCQLGNGNEVRTQSCAVFNIDWNPRDFLSNNYESGIHQSLRTVIAITGQTDHANLTTVGEYLKMNWPGEDEYLVAAVGQALLGGNGRSSRLKKSCRRVKKNRSLSFDASMKTLTVTGNEAFIISIAQQVAWLAAVCQEKKDQLTYAYVGFEEVSSRDSGDSVFNIDVKLEKIPLEKERGRCWRNLVGSAVLIQGFPVPARNHGEQGLEVDIPIMAAISGTPKAVTFGDGFVFKARCHALVPTKRLGSSIQWHVLDAYPQKLEWEDIDKACPNRLRGRANNDVLRKYKSFFGWCPRVVELLGTERFEYSTVAYSKASIISKRIQLEKLVFGFSQWVTLTADISFGKKDGVVNQRPDDYETVLDDARSTHIILHDTTQKRAVQTNAEDLILHLLLHRRENQKADTQQVANSISGEPFVFANPDRRATPTRQVMIDNAEKISSLRKQFSNADGQARRFKDEVKLVYSTIDALWANTYASEGKSSLKVGFSIGPDVHGWEYMDVLKDYKSTKPKSIRLKKTCGNWNKYATDIEAVVLFAADIGDVLLPAQPSVSCPGLASLPRDECYLAVRVGSIQNLFSRQGCLQDQRKLTDSGLTLHCHTDLFKACKVVNTSPWSQPCCGNHVARLVKSSALPRNHRPTAFKEDGAVIIGHAKSSNFSVARGWKQNYASTPARSSSTDQRASFKTKGKSPQLVADNQKTVDVMLRGPPVGDGCGAVIGPKTIPHRESPYSCPSVQPSVTSGPSSSPSSIPTSSSRTASSNTSASLNRTWTITASPGTPCNGGKTENLDVKGKGPMVIATAHLSNMRPTT